MGSQQFCLRWNNHQMNMLNVFDQLLHNGDFVDVTLSCSGGKIKAHKMVLSACSPYFQELFRDNPCKHPIVILKDMKMMELRSIVEFMYKGEINVSQDQLPALLKTAESLKVKGLAEVSSSGSKAVAGDQMTSNGSPDGEEGSAQPASNGNTGVGGTPRFSGEGNSQSDGRISPHAKRKRHRPRRHSNDESNNEEMEEKNEVAKDGSKSSVLKSEPLEVNEPQIELLMDDEQFPRLDASMNDQDRTANDSRDGNSRLSQSDMMEMSQPSTSGAHASAGGPSLAKFPFGANSGSSPTTTSTPCSNYVPWRSVKGPGPCKRWEEGTMAAAVRAVFKMGVPLIHASRRYGIPYPTLFYYTSRVRHLLKPEENNREESSSSENQVSAVWNNRSARNRRFGSCINSGLNDLYYRNDIGANKSSNMMKKIKEHRQMIRKAMNTIFTHQEMATHSLTGRKAFGNDPLPALDPNKVSLVFDYLHRQLPQFGGSIIKQAMAQVLVCERRLYDRRTTLPIFQRGKSP